MSISANELRIGNWVSFRYRLKGETLDRPCKVISISESTVVALDKGDSLVSDFFPVPLTPEMLIKAGFDKCCDGHEYRIALPLGNGTDLVIEVLQEDSGPYDALISDSIADEVPKNYSYVKAVKSLHQLQNLHFALTGTELEVNL